MNAHKLALVSGALIGAIATVSLATSPAKAATDTYVVCNRWNECWRVHEHYATYPPDAKIIYRDGTWWEEHARDPQWRELPDPSDEKGWYDKDGVWRPFEPVPPPQ